MKKALLFSILFVSCISAYSQPDYRGFVETGMSSILGKNSGYSYQLSTSHGVKTGSTYIGLAIGYDIYAVNNPRYIEGSSEPDYNISTSDPHYLPIFCATNTWDKRLTEFTIPVALNVKKYYDFTVINPVIDLKAGYSIGRFRYTGWFGECGLGARVSSFGPFSLNASIFYRYFYIGHVDEDGVGVKIHGGKLNNAGAKITLEF